MSNKKNLDGEGDNSELRKTLSSKLGRKLGRDMIELSVFFMPAAQLTALPNEPTNVSLTREWKKRRKKDYFEEQMIVFNEIHGFTGKTGFVVACTLDLLRSWKYELLEPK